MSVAARTLAGGQLRYDCRNLFRQLWVECQLTDASNYRAVFEAKRKF